ncbi:MAG: hypothetical protein HF314_17180 [Ignavibacteria bacterium]|jgi:hypothetical protein|nr:hypothetical protein [Ignavibacteria bacterium]MCU7504819.1 hypothetical protein [Ignavibacteria bacterium]MCU7517705.1 hypothetical protein [Ignavibacteria bacterium]
MGPAIVGVFIPIIITVTIGLVLITLAYFKSRERQMLIERGLPPEEIKQFFANKDKANPFLLTKIGIIAIFFGIGIGLGMYLQELTNQEFWLVLFLFTLTGLGFIIANLLGRKLEKTY